MHPPVVTLKFSHQLTCTIVTACEGNCCNREIDSILAWPLYEFVVLIRKAQVECLIIIAPSLLPDGRVI